MRKLFAVLALGLFALIALATRPGSDVPLVHAGPPTTFNVAAGEQQYIVPAGVTRVIVEARGGKGGNAGIVTGVPACTTGALGGVGDQVTTILTVTPGQILYVNVGGNGTVTAGGFNGGGNGANHGIPTEQGAGGGGGSDVRTAPGAPATRVVVAGGGGGAGGCGNAPTSFGGPGGNAAANGINGVPSPGGGGGGATGAIPGAAGLHGSPGVAPTGGTALGIGGNGGAGANQTFQSGDGGGGGGGLAGGGGGGGGGQALGGGGGGGGGGSSFADPAVTANTITIPHPDGQASVGRVVITPIDPLTVTKSFNPASIQVGGSSIVGIVVTNINAFALNGVTFTDTLPAGVTTNGAPTTFGGHLLCGGTLSSTATSVTVTNATLGANATCAVGISVTSATPGTYINLPFIVTTTEGVTATSNPATLVVGAVAAPTLTPTAIPSATSTPTPTVTPVIMPVKPVIPQVFQHVPQGIFNGTRNNTPTPVRQAVAPASVAPAAPMPVLRPPSTGDAGLKAERDAWSYAPYLAMATVFSLSAGVVWRMNQR